MKEYLKKLNIKHLILLIIFIVCSTVVFGDIIYIFLNLNKSVQFTIFGCISFAFCAMIAIILFDYFFENEDK